MKTVINVSLALVMTGAPVTMVIADDSQPAAETAVTPQSASNTANTFGSAEERRAWSKSLFEGRCQMCHQLPEPSMLNEKQWRLVLGTMKHRMQQVNVPPLTEEETRMLVEYLVEQGR